MNTQIVNPLNSNAKVIGLFFFENDKAMSSVQAELDNKFQNVISKNIKTNFNGKYNEIMTFPLENGVKILAIGLGKKEEFNLNVLREMAAACSKFAKKYAKDEPLALELVHLEDEAEDAKETVIGFNMGVYAFNKYKETKNKISGLELLKTGDTGSAQTGAKKGEILSNSMNFTKDMVFDSAEVITPAKVSEIAQNLAYNYGIEIKIFDKDELKKMGFNTFLAVGQGSAQPPKFIHLVYKSENPRKKVALIGKGITFDSGGLDIKPASSMLTMKTDMTGAATVLGVMKAICELKPDIELHCMSALCENMPSGSSYKVGDVIVSKSGKTIEVDNTDAEGRLTLADVLTYADEIYPDEVIDIATLTGAVIVALGQNITGIMGNNQSQIDKFKEIADKTGERVWQLPIYDDMKESLKSDIADMKNTGSRHAGSSVAGRFLQNYTKSQSWLHIDIAGTAYIDKPYKEIQKGVTGVMVRTLVNYLVS